MYKIYYNEKLICLLHHAWEAYINIKIGSTLKIPYKGNPRHLLSVLDKMEKNTELQEVYILYNDVKKLKSDFFKLFTIVPAAGGLVINPKGDVLLIFRRGCWDLPKGKLDPGESKRKAAVREVMEETGIDDAVIINKITTTYHIYGKSNSKRFMKPTSWYNMLSHSENFKPEKDEGIEKVIWVQGLNKHLYGFKPIYKNIRQVIKQYYSLIDFN